MTDEEWEMRHHAIIEIYESCCRNCNKRYWEACIGIHTCLERVDGCKMALDKYTEEYNKR